jgi:hypothetical protein
LLRAAHAPADYFALHRELLSASLGAVPDPAEIPTEPERRTGAQYLTIEAAVLALTGLQIQRRSARRAMHTLTAEAGDVLQKRRALRIVQRTDR